MMLRIQAERLAGLQLDLEEYKASYQLTGQRLAAHAPDAVVLHPGPIIRGMEITAGVADGVQSAILEQVTNGVAIRMAVMERALTRMRPRQAAGSRRRPRMTALAIRGGHLIDPAAGVDAPKDILLKDGRVAEIAGAGKLKTSQRRAGPRRDGTHRRAGTDRHSCASARAGPGLQRNHRHRNGRGGSGRIHQRGRDAEHHAGQRLARNHALDAGAGARRAGARLSHRRGHARIER